MASESRCCIASQRQGVRDFVVTDLDLVDVDVYGYSVATKASDTAVN
jgi:hypothetical protein